VRQAVEAAAREKIERPRSETVDGTLLDKEPVRGTISASKEDAASGTLLWTLSNGIRVIIKETANKNNEIALYALARGGLTDTDTEEFASARFAAELFEASGAGPYTRTELMRRLAGRQISLNVWVHDFTRGLSGYSTRGDLKTFFELLHLTFTGPRIDEDAARVLKDQYRTSLARKDENPHIYFSDELQKFMYGDNPYFRPLETADIEKISLAGAKNFITRALAPQDYTFVFTGNVDIDALRSYTETYLASIPGGTPWQRRGDPEIARPGKTEKQLYKGREEQSAAFIAWFTPMEYSDTGMAAARVLTEYLDIVLTEKIRETLGGVYSIFADAGLSPIPGGELYLTLSFYCDPARAKELSAAVEAEAAAVAAGRIDHTVLGEAIAALKMDQNQSVQNNLYLARAYAQFAMLNMPLDQLEKRPALYDGVNAEALRRRAGALMPGGPARLLLYPENKR
jgi:zinc protease